MTVRLLPALRWNYMVSLLNSFSVTGITMPLLPFLDLLEDFVDFFLTNTEPSITLN